MCRNRMHTDGILGRPRPSPTRRDQDRRKPQGQESAGQDRKKSFATGLARNGLAATHPSRSSSSSNFQHYSTWFEIIARHICRQSATLSFFRLCLFVPKWSQHANYVRQWPHQHWRTKIRVDCGDLHNQTLAGNPRGQKQSQPSHNCPYSVYLGNELVASICSEPFRSH